MHIPVHSPWLPGYIDVAQTILIIFIMAGLFPDRRHIYIYIYIYIFADAYTKLEKIYEIMYFKCIVQIKSNIILGKV